MCHSNNLILVSPPASQNSWSHTYSSAQLRHLNTKVNQDNRLQVLPPGTISRIRQVRINRRPIKDTKQPHITNNCNCNNLIYVTVTNKVGKETACTIKLATLNARSVKKQRWNDSKWIHQRQNRHRPTNWNLPQWHTWRPSINQPVWSHTIKLHINTINMPIRREEE